MADNNTSIQIQVTAKDETTRVLKGVESSVIRFVGAVSAALATIRVVTFPIQEAAEFEKELLNVGKTTEYSAGQLRELGDELKAISQRLNISEVDLAKVAAAGGQLGIGGEEGVKGLVAFTEAAARFSSVLDVTVEDAANGIGKLSNIFGIAITDAERISSLLNEVSNRSTASGEDLLDIIQRIGTAQGTLSIQQSAALAATGRDLGLTLETIGTSFNKIFLDLNTKSKEVATLVGLPVEAFSKILQTDGIQALQLYLDALAKLPATQRSALSEQITGGGRIAALVTSLINDANAGYTLLNRNLDAAADGFESGTSAMNEQQRVLQGLNAQLDILVNTFKATAETVGRGALPFLRELTVQMQALLRSEETVRVFTQFGQALGAIAVSIVRFIGFIGENEVALTALVKVMQLFVGIKIVSAIAGGATALVAYVQRIRAASAALTGLALGNREVISSIAQQAAAATAAGTSQLTIAARAGVALNGLFSGLFSLQDQLNDGIATQRVAEEAIIAARERRNIIVAQETAEQVRLNALIKQRGAAVAAEAIANGRSQAQAQQAAAASVAANRNLLLLSRQRVAAVRAETAAEVAKQQVIIRTARLQADSAATALRDTSRIGIVAGAAKVGIEGFIGAISKGFGVLVRGLGVVGIAVALLDLLGLLEPLIAGFKEFFGVTEDAEVAAQAAAREQIKRFEDQKKAADELAERYDRLVDRWRNSPKQGEGALEQSLDGLFAKLEVVQGKIRSLMVSDATAESNLANLENVVASLGVQLDEANEKMQELVAGRNAAQGSGTRSFISELFPAIAKRALTDYNAEIEKQQKLIDGLSARVRQATESQNVYRNVQLRNAQQVGEAQALEREAIQQLTEQWSDGGFRLVQLLQANVVALDAQAKARQKLSDLESNAADKDKNDLETEAYAAAKSQLELVSQQVNETSEALRIAQGEAGIAASRFLDIAVPPALRSSLDAVNQRVSLLNVITGQSIETLKSQAQSAAEAVDQANQQVVAVEQRTQEQIERIRRESAIRVAQSDGVGGVSVSSEILEQEKKRRDELIRQVEEKSRAETAAAVKRRAEATQLLAGINREIDLNRQLGQSKDRLTRTSEQQEIQARRRVVALAGESVAIEKLVKAQEGVAKAARTTADAMASAYDKAKKDLEDGISKELDNIADRQERIINRANTLARSRLETNLDRSQQSRVREQERILDLTRAQLEADGASAEESDRVLGNLEEQNRRENESAENHKQELLLKKDIENQQKLIISGQQTVNGLLKEANDLAKQSEAAKASGNVVLAGKLAEQAVLAMDRAKQAAEKLNAQIEKFRNLADTPVKDTFGFDKFIVTDAEITEFEKQYARITKTVTETSATVLEIAKNMTAEAAQAQEGVLKALGDKAEEINKEMQDIAKNVPGLSENLRPIGEAMEKAANSSGVLDQNLKSIANASLDNIQKFNVMDRNANAANTIAEAMERTSLAISKGGILDLAKADFTKGLAEALKIPEKTINENTAKVQQKLSEAGFNAKIEFPDARDGLQTQLSASPFTAAVNLVPNGGGSATPIQENAEGGYIQGPGTGTSDSILSWLSHGEFVMDALTTRMFGPGFFAGLQQFARGGIGGLTSIFKTGRFGLPAAATGGFVGSFKGVGDSFGSSGGSMLQPINLQFGNDTVTAYTDARGGNDLQRVARREKLKKGSRVGVGRG